jgi:hypothetical protein
MAVTRYPPRTILLGGEHPGAEGGNVRVNDYVAGAELTPGMVIETFNDGGELKWRPHSAAANMRSTAVCLERTMLNHTIDDVVPAGDLVESAYFSPGIKFLAMIPSGADIDVGDLLQSNGDGLLKEATDNTAAANVAWFRALDGPGAVTVRTRIRVEVL